MDVCINNKMRLAIVAKIEKCVKNGLSIKQKKKEKKNHANQMKIEAREHKSEVPMVMMMMMKSMEISLAV